MLKIQIEDLIYKAPDEKVVKPLGWYYIGLTWFSLIHRLK
jgi:hypothetical protein